MVHEREWMARVAAEIGQRVAFYRHERGLTAQQLADRCGVPSITRVVIARLENGRRDAVSTAELQVLAHALGVPAILLLFPLGRADTVEVLPGLEVRPDAAIEWFMGNSGDPADPTAPSQLGDANPLALWAEQFRIEDSIAKMDSYRASAIDPAHQPAWPVRDPLVTPSIFAENIRVLVDSLHRVRRTAREVFGLTPPRLRPETLRVILMHDFPNLAVEDMQDVQEMAREGEPEILRALGSKEFGDLRERMLADPEVRAQLERIEREEAGNGEHC